MQHAQDPHAVALDSIRDDMRGAVDHEFPCTANAARTSGRRKTDQRFSLSFNPEIDLDRGPRIVRLDIVEDFIAILQRHSGPVQPHWLACLACCTSPAQRIGPPLSEMLLHLFMRNSRTVIFQRLLDFRPKPLVMLTLFLPVPDEFAHELAQQLRSRLVHSGCLGNKCISQFGLELDGENSFFGQGVQLQR
jgi:hypothetical protein